MGSGVQSVGIGLLILVVVIALMNSFASPKVPTSMEHLQGTAPSAGRCVAVPPGKQVQFIDPPMMAGSLPATIAPAPVSPHLVQQPVAAAVQQPTMQPEAKMAPVQQVPQGAPHATPVSNAGSVSQPPAAQTEALENCYLDCLDPPATVRANVMQNCSSLQGQAMINCLHEHGVTNTAEIFSKCNYCDKLAEKFSDYDPLSMDYAPAMEPERILCTGNVQGPGPTQNGPGLREPFWCPRREKTFMTESLDPYGYCCGKFYSNMSQGYQQCVASGAGVNPPPPGR